MVPNADSVALNVGINIRGPEYPWLLFISFKFVLHTTCLHFNEATCVYQCITNNQASFHLW